MSDQTPPPPPPGSGQQPPYGGGYGGQPPYGGGYGQQPPYGGGGPGQQPPYGGGYGGQPPYGAPAPGGSNKKAVWALVTGIFSLLCCSPAGIVAIILGRNAQAEIASTGQQGGGMAKAGFILGIVALALMALSILLFATGALTFDGNFSTT